MDKANKANKSNKAHVAGAALGIALALTVHLTGATDPTPHAAAHGRPNRECQVWAAMIEAPLGDPRIQMIGCDDEMDGTYSRAEGPCNAIARAVWRREKNLFTIHESVTAKRPGCTLFEDGSWSH